MFAHVYGFYQTKTDGKFNNCPLATFSFYLFGHISCHGKTHMLAQVSLKSCALLLVRYD